jgi:hypothetical protein
MQIDLGKVSIDFECSKCGNTELKVAITELIEVGCPMCVKCEEEMEYVCAHLEEK